MAADQVSSTTLITDSSGQVVSQVRYYPYGKLRWTGTGSLGTNRTYTAQRDDGYINLLDYGSRQYDPELGRFAGSVACLSNVSLCVTGAKTVLGIGGAAAEACKYGECVDKLKEIGDKADEIFTPASANPPGHLPDLIISDNQFGEKVGKHAQNFSLNPNDAGDRELFNNMIYDIRDNFDEVRQGNWRGGYTDAYFFRQEDVVVVTDAEGNFITILHEGIDNSWFNSAERIK